MASKNSIKAFTKNYNDNKVDSNNKEYEFDDIEEVSDDIIQQEIEQYQKDEEIKAERRLRKNKKDEVQFRVERFKETKNLKDWKYITNRLTKPLIKFLHNYTSNSVLIEDTVAVTFARAYERIDEYDVLKSKFSTWIWMIAYRQCLYDIKMENRIPTVSLDIMDYIEIDSNGEEANNGDYANRTDTTQSSIDYYIIDNQKTGHILELNASDITRQLYDISINAIEHIDNPTTKEVIKLKIIEDITIREIGEKLQLNTSNVKNHLYKGKRELADSIKKEYPDLCELYLDVLYNNDNEGGKDYIA